MSDSPKLEQAPGSRYRAVKAMAMTRVEFMCAKRAVLFDDDLCDMSTALFWCDFEPRQVMCVWRIR